jgi:WD40 repeat protein
VCSNKTLQIFGLYGRNFKRVKEEHTTEVQYAIWYADKHRAWITASKLPELPCSSPAKSGRPAKPIRPSKLNRGDSSCDRVAREPLRSSRAEKIDDKTQGLNYLNDWSFNSIGPKFAPHRSWRGHKAQIMDMVEIQSPISVATCSLDRTIKMWDLGTGQKLGRLDPKHMSGVRCLDYTPDFSGSIVSVGHENTIKVWSPEVSIQRAYVGCLEGHNTAVMSAKFIAQSPLLISIDEKLSIRVWDIRTLACVQVITQNRKRFGCNGLCVAGAQHKFAIYGRRMILFDTTLERVGKKEVKPMEEAYPFRVEFNTHYKTFVVVTKYLPFPKIQW